MTTDLASLLIATLLIPQFCDSHPKTSKQRQQIEQNQPPLLLIVGFDGLKFDFIEPGNMPNLYKLAKSGVWADQGITPIFPARTLPNFYAISTGLYAESHGLVSNDFFDPIENDNYKKGSAEGKWYNGVPIWVANDRIPGHRSGCMRWPGCEANILGSTPRFTAHFEEGLTGIAKWREEFHTIMDWFRHPDTPINLGLFFISEPDETEHKYNIEGPEVKAKYKEVDEFIGYMLQKVENSPRLRDKLNIIVLSDHGHVNIHKTRDAINLKNYIPRSQMDQFYKNGYTYLPKPGTSSEEVTKFYDALVSAKKRDNLRYSVYWKQDIPDRFHYKNSPRIGPIMVLPDLGVSIMYTSRVSSRERIVGYHGFDNEHITMRGSFVAAGPAFKTGRKVPVFSNIHIYPALNHVLDIAPPAASNGSLSVLWHHLEGNPDAESDAGNFEQTHTADVSAKSGLLSANFFDYLSWLVTHNTTYKT